MIDYLSFAIALFAVVLGGAIAIRFKVPSVLIFLMLGALIGTYNLVGQSGLFNTLGQLGSIILLFTIGTEFSLERLIRTGVGRAATIAALEMLISFVLLFVIFSTFVGAAAALLVALAFSITSTGVTVKLFQQLNLSERNFYLILKVNIIEDLIAVFAYSAVSSLSIEAGHTAVALLASFLISIVLFVIAYYTFSLAFDRIVSKHRIPEDDVLPLAFGVLLLFVYIAASLNLSAAFGAYIAGSIVSGWTKRFRSLEGDLRRFSYLFVSFFFLTIGLSVNLNTVDYALFLFVFPIILIVKFIGVYAGSYVATKSVDTSFFISVGMITRGELSLVIVSSAIAAGLLPQSYLGLTAFVVFFSAMIAYVMLSKAEKLDGAIMRAIMAHAGFLSGRNR